MKIGICVPALGPHVNRAAVRDFAIGAEKAGFDSLWVQEHFMWRQVPKTGYAGAPGVPMPTPYQSLLQPLEMLAFCAAVTDRVQLGTSILVTAYHRPLMLARRLATLDVLSEGRILAGLGLGWMAEEYEHMDTPFERRGGRMTDFVKALKAGFLPDPVSYQGPFFSYPESHSSPKPVQRDELGNPCVPILTGGGNPKSLARCARYAHGWNPAGMPASMCGEIRANLNEMAKGFGRSINFPIYLRVFNNPTMPGIPEWDGGFFGRMSWSGGIDAQAKQVEDCKAAGIDHVIIETNFWEPNPSPEFWFKQLDWFTPLVTVAHG
jgi:probable F420-dependent oxidoreductase